MKVLQVKQYNDLEMNKWEEAVEKWKEDCCSNNIIPQIAFFGFRISNGELHKTGYVAFDEHRSVRAWTKKEAIKKYNERIK